MNVSQQQAIRERVAEDYAKAVSQTGPASCCGAPVEQKGVTATWAGYGAELSDLPEDVVVNSFGCGNPTKFSDVREGETVIDLGSGAGIDLLLAAKRVGPTGHVIGIDMTDEMIARANENIASAGAANVESRKGYIEEMPVEDGIADWVISNCVINLSPDKPRVFSEIARVLKPGGRILVSDIVVDSLPESLRNDPRLYSDCVAGAISEQAYIQGLNDAGLVDVEIVDRLVYEPAQIEQFLASECSDENSSSCCEEAKADASVSTTAHNLAGKIASITIAAHKA